MSNYNEFNNQNYNTNTNQNPDNNFMNNITNEKFINMASSIDLDTLNGTNIMDLGRDSNVPTLNNSTPLNPMSSFNSMPMPTFNNMGSFNNVSPMNNMGAMNSVQTFNNLPLANTANYNVPPQNNSQNIGQDKHLVKSITKELINNLRENNISLHDDNGSYNSNYSKKSNKNIEHIDSIPNDYENENNYDNRGESFEYVKK